MNPNIRTIVSFSRIAERIEADGWDWLQLSLTGDYIQNLSVLSVMAIFHQLSKGSVVPELPSNAGDNIANTNQNRWAVKAVNSGRTFEAHAL